MFPVDLEPWRGILSRLRVASDGLGMIPDGGKALVVQTGGDVD